MRKVFNNKVLLFIVAILLLSNIAMLFYFLALRDPAKRNSHGDRQKSSISVFLQNDIGFSEDQMTVFDKTRQKHRQTMKPLFENIRAAKVHFYGFLTSPAVTDSILTAAALKIGENQQYLDMQTFQNFREIRNLCNPRQQVKYDSLIVNEIGKMWFPSWKGNSHQGRDTIKSIHR